MALAQALADPKGSVVGGSQLTGLPAVDRHALHEGTSERKPPWLPHLEWGLEEAEALGALGPLAL